MALVGVNGATACGTIFNEFFFPLHGHKNAAQSLFTFMAVWKYQSNILVREMDDHIWYTSIWIVYWNNSQGGLTAIVVM
jgi:hypothetical protein